jgi:hypothetical protein
MKEGHWRTKTSHRMRSLDEAFSMHFSKLVSNFKFIDENKKFSFKRIRDVYPGYEFFSIPNLGSKGFPDPQPHQRILNFNPKNCFLKLSEI